MAPRKLSRYTFSRGIRDRNGAMILTQPPPFPYRDLADNKTIVVSRGDTLFTLAGREYRKIDPERASGLWWIIAGFQPTPILDATLVLEEGTTIIVPSPRTVLELVFDERRRINA